MRPGAWDDMWHMYRLTGQFDVEPPVSSSSIMLGIHFIYPQRVEMLNEPCLNPEENLVPVVWQCSALTTELPDIKSLLKYL